MDETEKMLFSDLSDDIKILNNNVLYLCTKSAASESRLKNIENVINGTTERLNICENKVNTLRTWGIAIGSVIILLIPIISAMV